MANALFICEPREFIRVPLAEGTLLRSLSPTRLDELANAYHQAYVGSPHEMTAAEARSEIDLTWAGEYGRLLANASLGVWVGNELAGAIVTVEDPPWDNVPRGAFILELFVTPPHRRMGLGRLLVQRVQNALRTRIALRVDDSAPQAKALYLSLGFQPSSHDHTVKPHDQGS
ncbi:MAG: GNAT family N-acetyltransferase [Microcella sp.]|uniref:GNAT family N-acetyltransferase n=1 Tax=Microcella sp. TaxID=1913979 RepID=UPI0024C5C38D|nr:GNAT family N-acetyltransferase [Microcella sp.]UYN82894.1 MAG: GNAT family N-acetyltransferase [Microcella sp.]